MNTLPRLALATLLAAVPSAALAGNACDFYQGPNYSGEKFTLYQGHALTTGSDAPAVSDAVTSRPDYQQFEDPRWRGNVLSVRVQEGCTSYMHNGAEAKAFSSDTPMTPFGEDGVAFGCTCN